MPLRWRSRRRFDGIVAGERSLAGQNRTVDSVASIVDNRRKSVCFRKPCAAISSLLVMLTTQSICNVRGAGNLPRLLLEATVCRVT